MAMKKTWHFVVLILAILGALYVAHMVTSHQGQSIIPSLGSK
jgi:hypothetical protein